MAFSGIRVALIAGVLLFVGGTAGAATMVTGALRVRPTGEFSCLFTNIGNRDMRVSIQMVNMNGTVIAQADPIVAPTKTYHFKDQSPAGEATHCEFEFIGNPKYFRALACVGTDTSGCTAVAPAQ
ncbi:MAG TPA: hypothetical protein VGR62_22980 [Candidatus Binatia bacterium]|jgi:hypothetical protein|nr:hypothetical protein [Candidatus Binatia bacterium]